MSLPPEFKYPWPFPKRRTFAYELKSKLTMTAVYLATKAVFPLLNRMNVKNKQVLLKALDDRSRPLITVSNHKCNIDDPLLWSMFTIREFFRYINRWRYVLAAHNICFTNPVYTNVFSLGRCVPCVRGAGINQRGVDECIEALSRNEWVHMFPEGKVTLEPIRIKWGIARLINEAARPPILLPIHAHGMNDVLSTTKPYYLKIGKTVDVTIGKPYDTSELRRRYADFTDAERRLKIADFVQNYMISLGNTNKDR